MAGIVSVLEHSISLWWSKPYASIL